LLDNADAEEVSDEILVAFLVEPDRRVLVEAEEELSPDALALGAQERVAQRTDLAEEERVLELPVVLFVDPFRELVGKCADRVDPRLLHRHDVLQKQLSERPGASAGVLVFYVASLRLDATEYVVPEPSGRGGVVGEAGVEDRAELLEGGVACPS